MSKFSFSLNRLISNLLTINNSEEFSVAPGEETKATTVRLAPEVKKFCDVQAEKLGISAQAFISMVLKGVMLETISPVKAEITLMQERFFELFKLHNVPVADIPELLMDFNISLSTIADNGRLLDAYSSKVVQFLSNTFCVKESWLKGQDNFAAHHTEWRTWYKSEYSFCSKLMDMLKAGERPRVMIIKNNDYHLDLIDAYDPSINKDDRVKVIVEGKKNYGEGKHFSYYKNYTAEPWKYSKSRLSLKSIVLFCHLFDIYVDGYSVTPDLFEEIDSDKNLFALHRSKLNQIGWHPDDYIDALEEKEPYRTSKPQDELGYVFDTFLKGQLHNLILNELSDEKTFRHEIKQMYLNKICAYLDNEQEHGLPYEKIKYINQEITASMQNIQKESA